jgi:hypothetical protein
MGKRVVAVGVKMSEDDFSLLKKAADTIWPGAVLTNSGIVLGLAKLGAAETVKRKPKNKSG